MESFVRPPFVTDAFVCSVILHLAPVVDLSGGERGACLASPFLEPHLEMFRA